MKETISLDKLLNMHNEILSIAQKNENLNDLLAVQDYKNYDVIQIKQKLQLLFKKFQAAKYLNKFPVETIKNSSFVYDVCNTQKQNTTTSYVENIVENHTDKEIWVTLFYNNTMILAHKLTKKEAVYFTNTFLLHKTEEKIAESLEICKTSLQKIKKSCLVKVWIELKDFLEENMY